MIIHPDPRDGVALAAFKSERWPASRRNSGRLQIGIPGRLRRNPHFSEPALKFDFGIALECWLASRRAPERSRQCGKRVARPSALDPGVKQNWQPSQLGKPEFGADV